MSFEHCIEQSKQYCEDDAILPSGSVYPLPKNDTPCTSGIIYAIIKLSATHLRGGEQMLYWRVVTEVVFDDFGQRGAV